MPPKCSVEGNSVVELLLLKPNSVIKRGVDLDFVFLFNNAWCIVIVGMETCPHLSSTYPILLFWKPIHGHQVSLDQISF